MFVRTMICMAWHFVVKNVRLLVTIRYYVETAEHVVRIISRFTFWNFEIILNEDVGVQTRSRRL